MTLYKINPGKYRHPVTLQHKSTDRDTYGRTVESWVTIAYLRAGIYPISGREIFTRDFAGSEITHRIHIRYDPTLTVTSDMRIMFGNRVFAIDAPPINFQERNIEWQLMCKEVQDWQT